MNTDDLRKGALAVHLATEPSVARDISDMLNWSANVIDTCESAVWSSSQAPGKFRCWIIKKIFPEYVQFIESVRDGLYWA